MAGDECHVSTAQHRHPCQRIAHFSSRMVREVAHRIDRFLGRTGGHKDLLSSEILRVGDRAENIFQDQPLIRKFALSGIAAGEQTACRFDDGKAVMF